MMMMRRGDLNLNQFGDSVKEGLKQTMFQHESIFRNQVRELHRLYWTQKNLMRELSRKAATECREAAEEKKAFFVPSQSRVVGSMKEGNVGVLEVAKGKYIETNENRQSGFNLQLPADEYIKDSIGDGFVTGSEMVRTNCSTREAIVEKGGANRSLLCERSSMYCCEVIDLEESLNMGSHVEAYGISSSGVKDPTGKGREMCGSRPNIEFEMVSSGLAPAGNHLHAGHSERWLEQKLSHSGAGLSETIAAAFIDRSTDSTQKQPLPSCKLMLFDLNLAQNDESSHDLRDPMLTFASPSSSSSVVQHEHLWRDQGNRCPKETSVAPKPDAPYLASIISEEKNADCLFHGCHDSQSSKVTENFPKQAHVAGNKVQGSDSKGSAECCRNSVEGFSSGSNGGVPNSTKGPTLSSTSLSKPVEENGDSLSGKLHSVTHSDSRREASIITSSNDIEDKQANQEGGEEDTVSSHAIARDQKQQDRLVEKNPTGSKSNHITGSSDCSSLDKSMEEYSGTTQLDPLVAENLQQKSCYVKQQQNQGQKIVSAAEALLCISLAKSSSAVGQLDTTGLVEIENEEDKSDQPQYSYDSFESMTLKLSEIRNDEHLMPTRPTEKETGKDADGVNKLRRGRGRVVRDFQKDVLPGMVSLSRHEICEDLHNIGYELRKNGSRRACGENWFVPIRSRRSRRYSAGRRS